MSKSLSILKFVIHKHGIIFSIYLIIFLILVSAVFTYQYKKELDSNQDYQQSIEEIIILKKSIIANLNTNDMSIRGYLLVKNEAFLETYTRHKQIQRNELDILKKKLPLFGFDISHLRIVQDKLEEYYDRMDEVITLFETGQTETALDIINED